MSALDSLPFIHSELFLTATLFVILILDLFVKEKKWFGWLSVLAIVVAFAISPPASSPQQLFFGYFTWDALTFFFKIVAYLTVGLTILASLAYEKIHKSQQGELYILLIAMAMLLTFMGGVTNLLMIFLAIESVSLISYLLVGFQKFDKFSSEAALKYVLFGSVSSTVMLFGMSLLFGATGTIELAKIAEVLKQPMVSNIQGITLIGMMFLLVGIGFKISMVPFHAWAPDVYQGAPTPVTAFLTVAPKALGFAVIMRVLFMAFPQFIHKWTFLLTLLSILTMTVGNIIAISQSDVKRLLAYSSIAQAGYILVGLAVPGVLGSQAVLMYVVAYLFTNLGAFFTVLAIERNLGTNQLEAYNGLSERSPFLALALTMFLLSLAGIPPLAGFIGKIYIFSSAISAHSVSIAVAIALNSALAAFYYFKVVKAMYLTAPPQTGAPFHNPLPIKIAVCVTLLGTFLIGIWPMHAMRFVEQTLAFLPTF